jgi:hypothetical protein
MSESTAISQQKMPGLFGRFLTPAFSISGDTQFLFFVKSRDQRSMGDGTICPWPDSTVQIWTV